MKLATKLTAVCASLLMLSAAVLSGMMLWQVREQSYRALIQESEKDFQNFSAAFITAVSRDHIPAGTPEQQKVFLQYHFRSCSAEGAVLEHNGELLSAATPVDPRAYLELIPGGGVRSVRCRAAGMPCLILGQQHNWGTTQLCIYRVVDASGIHRELAQLMGRFAVIALLVCLLGLLLLNWLIRRTLAPLARLQKSAESIAAGNYSRRVGLKAEDEVGQLAADFDTMAAAVEHHVQELTDQNARQLLFIGGVAHEFKTPLTSLLLNADTLQTVYLSEEKRQELLGSMVNQLHWLENMVHKLLKLLSLNKSARILPASVPALLEKVTSLTAPTMRRYGTKLAVQCHADHLPMDPDLICSALVNLVENSAKASRPGQMITIRAGEHSLEVADSGRGIPEKDLARVTDPFYMGDPSRSKSNGGYGLGLALVREITVVHNARLEIQSTENVGTTVRILFPENGNITVNCP